MLKTSFGSVKTIKNDPVFGVGGGCKKKVAIWLESQRKICIFVEILTTTPFGCPFER